ncbi:MAG: 5'-methylthioadenosine/adenosylhomocysteine nucleosidase [Rikenellaceae bacterium]
MIGVIVAMGRELELVVSQMTSCERVSIGAIEYVRGEMNGRQVVVAQSGIGKVCSALCASEMISLFEPTVVINTGVAGGLDSSLRVMDVVVGRETTYHDAWCGDGNVWGQIQGLPARFGADERLYNVAMACHSRVTLHGGLICSGDCFITSCEELNLMKARFEEVLAVDMESNSIAQVCHLKGVPFLSVRVISDTPGVDNHDAQYEDFWSEAPQTTFEVLRQIVAAC